MRKTWIFIVVSACLFGLGGHAAAGSLQFIDRSGTVSATANGDTVTDSLQLQTGDISVTAGTPQPGMDYAIATAQSSVTSDEIHLRLTSGVGEWGNNGEALAQIEVVFRVNQDTPFVVELEAAEASGAGWLGDRAYITLSNDDGVIFRRNVGGGFDSCNNDHPEADSVCRSGVLRRDTYRFEMIASSHAPSNCGSCKGYAVTSETELRVTLP